MAKKKKRPRPGDADPLAAYRRIRKPMPPPERVFEDRRRRADDRDAAREIREATSERPREGGTE
jgi:hypothetical protein